MRFHIITLLPKAIEEYANSSILGRAQKNKKIAVKTYDLRKWGVGKHRKVDDRPFGGGPGMVMAIKPIYEAVKGIKLKVTRSVVPAKAGIQTGSRIKSGMTEGNVKKGKVRIILFSTRGKLFTEKEAKRLAKYSDLILICGRYEGVDERVAKHIADEEISMGEFVLTGGEVPALAVVDAISRFIPGVLGKSESREDIKGSYVVYTRPAEFVSLEGKKWRAPKELLSGDPKKVQDLREKKK
jgi:tRNA (guanine37-N1)-methyltransferase